MTQEKIIIILEKVSEKASESWPVFGKKYFFMGKYSWNLPGKIFRKIPWVMPRNCKIWKKSGKIFRDISWVMPRFLEKFSGIRQYGLNEILSNNNVKTITSPAIIWSHLTSIYLFKVITARSEVGQMKVNFCWKILDLKSKQRNDVMTDDVPYLYSQLQPNTF